MKVRIVVDPYGLPLGHAAHCPCDACPEVPQLGAERMGALNDSLPPDDAEDSTENQSAQKEVS